MSHGTGSSYVVVSQAELDRRAVTEIRSRCGARAAELRGIATELGRLGAAASARSVAATAQREPPVDALAAWQAHEAACVQALASGRDALAEARRGTWAREVSAQLATIPSGIRLDVAPGAPRTDPADEPAASRLRASVAHAVELLSSLDDPAEAARILETARSVLALAVDDPPAAEGALTRLRADAQAASRAAETRRRLQARGQDLALAMAGIPGDEAARLRDRLSRATSADELDLVEAQVGAVRARADAEQDRAFVVEQTAAALRELGYEVDAGFVPAALGGRASVRRHDDARYGLELDFEPARARLLTEVVAFADDRASDDAAVASACTAIDALDAALAGSGVRLRRFHTLPPGEVAVQRRATSSVGELEARPRRRNPAERQRGAS